MSYKKNGQYYFPPELYQVKVLVLLGDIIDARVLFFTIFVSITINYRELLEKRTPDFDHP